MKNAKLIARRYAQALYKVSKIHHKVDVVYEEMISIQRIIESNFQLSKLIYNKFAPTKEMLVFLNTFIKEEEYSDLTRNFLVVLKTKRRFFLLKLINSNLYALVMGGKDIVPVDVTIAYAIDLKVMKKIKDQIAGLLKREVDVSMHINKRILGGLTIAYNSKILDLSLLARVNKLEKVFVQ